MRFVYIFCLAVFLIQSCGVKHTYTFSKDFSGTNSYKDEPALNDAVMINSLDSIMQVTYESLQKVNGIQKLEKIWNADSSEVQLNFSFPNLTVLNEAIIAAQNYGHGESEQYEFFELKKKTLIFHYPVLPKEVFEDEDYDILIPSIKYLMTFEFDHKVESISDEENFEISTSKNSVELITNPIDLLENTTDESLIIKLK